MGLWVLILIFRVPEVMHITCNTGPRAEGIHIRQILTAHVTTYAYTQFLTLICPHTGVEILYKQLCSLVTKRLEGIPYTIVSSSQPVPPSLFIS